jgi:hypothetical protein
VSKVRALSVRVVNCETATGWGHSAIVLTDPNCGSPKKVTITIDHPYDLQYLEEQIAKIRANWRRILEETP